MTGSHDLPHIPRKAEAELVSFWRWEHEDSVGATIRIEDGTEITLTFPLDSQLALDLLHALGERIPEKLTRIGTPGVVLTRFSPREDDDDEDGR